MTQFTITCIAVKWRDSKHAFWEYLATAEVCNVPNSGISDTDEQPRLEEPFFPLLEGHPLKKTHCQRYRTRKAWP